ncbi:MAG: UDP-N-acetylmuramoyl-tripeptide--D-alanyl-D-alanine ligase [Planctomycetota bacterium]
MLISIQQVVEATGVVVSASADSSTGRSPAIERVVTDSRQVAPGDLFVAIRGPNFDGHDFVAAACRAGAVACLVDKSSTVAERPAANEYAERLLRVENSVSALAALASWYRRSVLSDHTTVIAITGSNGKTTTKCMLDHVLQGRFTGRASIKSFNNEIGLPLTVLSAEPSDEYLIVEIGTNAPGEVSALADIAQPDIGVITSIGEAHLEGLGSLEGIAREKSSLLRHVKGNGQAFVNVDNEFIRPFLGSFSGSRLTTFGFDRSADLRVDNAIWDHTRTSFEIAMEFQAHVPMPGRHHAANAAVVFGVAHTMGMEAREILKRLGTVRAAEGRCRRIDLGDRTVVDDSYNANPASMSAAIGALAACSHGRKYIVMGDMLELGEESHRLHQHVIRTAVGAGLDGVLLFGGAMRGALEGFRTSAAAAPATAIHPLHFDEWEKAADYLSDRVGPGDTVWVKGSRLMGLERLVEFLRERWQRQHGGLPVER